MAKTTRSSISITPLDTNVSTTGKGGSPNTLLYPYSPYEELSMACIRLGLGSLQFGSKFRCSTDVCVSLVQVQVRVFLRLHRDIVCMCFGIVKKIRVRVISFLGKFPIGRKYFTVLFMLYYLHFLHKERSYLWKLNIFGVLRICTII